MSIYWTADQIELDHAKRKLKRYKDALERLAAGKFESGDHAQELAREALQKESEGS